MARREIVWSPEAKIEFFEILDFYYQRNGNAFYSRKINQKIKKTISKLRTNPRLGVVSSCKDIRVIIEGVFLIFYAISPTQIEILCITDSRINPDLFRYKK